MSYTPLKISIPTPCHEDWNGMQPVSETTARHCGSCAKNVTDFTGMTDAQMNAHIRESGGKLCGRFRPDQLERPLRAASGPRRSNPLKVAATAAGLMLAASGLDAQQIEKPAPVGQHNAIETQITGEIAAYDPSLRNDTVPAPKSPNYFPVMGRIAAPIPPPPPVPDTLAEDWLVGDIAYVEVDSSNHPTPPEIKVEPRIMGKISCPLPVPADSLAGPVPIVDPKPAAPVESRDSVPTPIDLPPHRMDGTLMGIIVIDQFPEPTGMDWFRDTIKNILAPSAPLEELPRHPRPRPDQLPPYLDKLTVSPNPFVDQLRLETELPEKQALTVEMLDPNGRLVYAAIWKARAGKSTFIILPERHKLTHAIYYLRVTDTRGRSVVKPVVR